MQIVRKDKSFCQKIEDDQVDFKDFVRVLAHFRLLFLINLKKPLSTEIYTITHTYVHT